MDSDQKILERPNFLWPFRILWLTEVKNKTNWYIAILDFSKAFDTVPHDNLLGKLAFYGITGPVVNWTSPFLKNREQWVVVDGEQSSAATVDSGVPQGTVLGPLLLLIHINDLPSVVDSQVRLFVDDCFSIDPYAPYQTRSCSNRTWLFWSDGAIHGACGLMHPNVIWYAFPCPQPHCSLLLTVRTSPPWGWYCQIPWHHHLSLAQLVPSC